MELVIALTILTTIWAISMFLSARLVYLEFIEFVSVGGYPWEMLVGTLLLGPLAFIGHWAASGMVNPLFHKSPNPVKRSYIHGYEAEKAFSKNLNSYRHAAKLLFIEPWDKVESERGWYL